MHSFLCHVVKGRLLILEAEDVRWLDKAHINDVNWLPADREVISKDRFDSSLCRWYHLL